MKCDCDIMEPVVKAAIDWRRNFIASRPIHEHPSHIQNLAMQVDIFLSAKRKGKGPRTRERNEESEG